MLVKVEEIIRDVRIAMELNRRDDSLAGEGDPDTLRLDELIRSKICDGIDLVHKEAPLRLLEPQSIGSDGLPGSAVKTDSEGKGKIKLPENYLRLCMFRIEGWRRAVYQALEENDVRAGLQGSRWKGIYGTEDKPVAVITRKNDGALYLEFYSSEDGKHIEDSGHILRAEIDEEKDEVRVSRGCYRPAVYRIASLTYASLGESERSQLMNQMSEGMLI